MLNATDFYKVGHKFQYPEGTELVFSNLTARKSRIPGIDKVVFFGLQYFLEKYLRGEWEETFFSLPKAHAVGMYKARIDRALGTDLDVSHIDALHDLGYLPLEFCAVPEGTEVPIGVPMMTFWNTYPRFYWLTNYIETVMSSVLWGMCTSATIALRYRRIISKYMREAGGDMSFVDWQGHDFSFRGMYGPEAAAMSGAAHLLAFNGTDTIPAIDLLEEYYAGTVVAGSVAATEHSVMCAGGKEEEIETYRRMIEDVYPTGIVSIVSDTWDYWNVWTTLLPQLKDKILARDGKVVIRPDSGDPFKIITGDDDAPVGSPAWYGSFQLAANLFGYTYNEKGFKVLNPKIGLIYGDSITPELCERICAELVRMGFVPNMVFGIGSFTYQYNTRDTFGFAIKATYCEINGEPKAIFKQPKTDDGTKFSARGLVTCERGEDGELKLKQDCSWYEVRESAEMPYVETQTYNEIINRVRA